NLAGGVENTLAAVLDCTVTPMGSRMLKRWLHMPVRNTDILRELNTRMFRLLGPDTGFDSIGDNNISWALSRLLDSMDVTNELPKT
ncbi:glucuronate isomerase, partial [Salmonella enterica subsp. enterica serovar Kentucky]|nr:glucuronate isomerase [Salmonella enterica subsp. enterica serovar Kentucky]